MKSKLKCMMLSSLVALGAVAGSCQRQDPAEELAAKSSPQPVKGDLVAAMVKDEVVREFIDANEQFLNAEDAHYNSLSESEKKVWRAELQAARDNGSDLPDPIRTPAQLDAFYKGQERRTAQIRARFPQLAQLSEDEQEAVRRRVVLALSRDSSPASN